MFSSPEIRALVNNFNETICVDGTFRITPNLFDSTLSVHVIIQQRAFPIFFALITNRTKDLYTEVLNNFKALLPRTFLPSDVITDFEPALQNALSETYPTARLTGCFFHLKQAMIKRIKKENLIGAYRNDPAIKQYLQSLMALGLLPPEEIVNTFNTVKDTMPADFNGKLTRFTNYVERQWIRKVGPQIISVYGRSVRTNNFVEYFHSSLRTKFPNAHPNIFKYLVNINNILQESKIKATQLLSGLEVARPRAVKMIIREDQLRRFETLLQNGEISPLRFLNLAMKHLQRYDDRILMKDNVADVDDDDVEEEEEEEEEQRVQNVNQNAYSVCLRNDKTHAFVPCGHTFCDECQQTLRRLRAHCPECRSHVESSIRIFM